MDDFLVVDGQVYMLYPYADFEEGEHRLKIVLKSDQFVERTVTASLLPTDACGLDYSTLTYPEDSSGFETNGLFEVSVSESLDFEFSFKPAVLKNDLDLDCDNLWKLDQVDIVSSSARIGEVFEVFETDVLLMSDGFKHVMINVEAKINSQWGIENKDMFPMELVLRFQTLQQNSRFTELLEEQVVLLLDLRCFFSVEILPVDEIFLSDVNMIFYKQKTKQDSVKSIQIPSFELSQPQCEDLKI